MMHRQTIELALTFIISRPADAAHILEQVPAEALAGFIKDLPHSQTAPMFEHMLPQYTASCCSYLEPNVAAGLLGSLKISTVAAIFRYMDATLRKSLLKMLPEKTRLACSLLLKYSEENVGAWMTTSITLIPEECTAEEALNRYTTEDSPLEHGILYVIDRDRKLKGSISVKTLLQLPANTPIASAIRKSVPHIYARSSIITTKQHPEWDASDILPVVNHHGQCIGILQHNELRNGLNQLAPYRDYPSHSNPFLNLCDVYGQSYVALAETFVSLTNTDQT